MGKRMLRVWEENRLGIIIHNDLLMGILTLIVKKKRD